MTEHHITIGRDLIGTIRQRGQKWEAFDADDVALGAFPSDRKAMSAVIAAARERRERVA